MVPVDGVAVSFWLTLAVGASAPIASLGSESATQLRAGEADFDSGMALFPKFTNKDFEPFCIRGHPWGTSQQR